MNYNKGGSGQFSRCLYNCHGTDDTTVSAQQEQIKKLYSYVVQMKMECQIQQQLV